MRSNLPPLIPRNVFFDNPDKAAVQISPDGEHLSWLAPVDGVLNVWVAPREDVDAGRPVTSETRRNLRDYAWAADSKHLIYSQDQGGDEDWHVHSVNLESGQDLDLSPMKGVSVRIEAMSSRFPEEVVLGINDRDPTLHDLHRVNVRTGERSLLLENEGFAGYTIDSFFVPRLAGRFRDDGGLDYFRREGEEWLPFLEVGMEDSMTTRPVGFDHAGEKLYSVDSVGRDTAALVESVLGGERRIVAESSKADAGGALMHPGDGRLQAVSFNYCRIEWEVVDESIEEDLKIVGALERGQMSITDRSLDDRWWTVVYVMDDGPVRYQLYDREKKTARFLFSSRASLEGLTLAKMSPEVIPSRDGLELVSYLSLPPGSSEADGARPKEPLPLVLLVHGGPWVRDSWGYHPVHQLLTNRGYAVLSVNYRGSTGLGKNFTNAAQLEWAGKMHDDLLDAVDWAVREGVADKDRVAIMGGSYGGYATLVGLTKTPDVFACGVDIVGPSNLLTLMASVPAYWKPQQVIWKTRVGDPDTEEGRAFLTERSPLTHVDAIKRPLLIAQGANDPRVKQSESDQIVAAMLEKKIPVTYCLFPDEGHGFVRPANNLAFYGVMEVFLAEHLGGRAEDIDTAQLKESSLRVPAGADQLHGRAQARADCSCGEVHDRM
jgi:dipeptidyl aminopeptidase/acylaminoacyl peptidase